MKTITRNGAPVAQLLQIAGRRVLTPEQEAALARTKVRREVLVADSTMPFAPEPLDRDALHER